MHIAFTSLISKLLKHYGIKSGTGFVNDKDTVYTLTIDKELQIHLIGQQKNYLNIACFIEAAIDRFNAVQLRQLLNLNAYHIEHPGFKIGINQDNTLTISTRLPLTELNDSDLYQLIEIFIERARSLMEWVQVSLSKNTEANTL